MTPVTREAQRAELHKTIWRIANDLRGAVDGWDFKTYVLGMLFYRFISENLTAYLNTLEHQAGDASFDYARLSDRDAEFGRDVTVEEKGFYILPSQLFANVRRRASRDENLNETLSAVFTEIEGSAVGAASEDDIKGLFDDLDVNSAQTRQHGRAAQPEAREAARRDRRPEPRQLRGQHDRPVRRRLRVPDADVRVEPPASPVASTTRRRR